MENPFCFQDAKRSQGNFSPAYSPPRRPPWLQLTSSFSLNEADDLGVTRAFSRFLPLPTRFFPRSPSIAGCSTLSSNLFQTSTCLNGYPDRRHVLALTIFGYPSVSRCVFFSLANPKAIRFVLVGFRRLLREYSRYRASFFFIFSGAPERD